MKYCSNCGEVVTPRIPQGDNRLRFVCDSCAVVHYQNPNNVTGAILSWENKVLLCKRAINPRFGLWTLPAGFMENNESVHQAAARESIEEANAQPGHLSLFGVFSIVHISHVYLMFYGKLLSSEISPGIESLEVGLFSEDEIPWDEIAFPVITYSLQLYFEQGVSSHRVHQARFSRGPDHSLEIHPE